MVPASLSSVHRCVGGDRSGRLLSSAESTIRLIFQGKCGNLGKSLSRRLIRVDMGQARRTVQNENCIVCGYARVVGGGDPLRPFPPRFRFCRCNARGSGNVRLRICVPAVHRIHQGHGGPSAEDHLLRTSGNGHQRRGDFRSGPCGDGLFVISWVHHGCDREHRFFTHTVLREHRSSVELHRKCA